jgi:hypothetical protein
MSYSLRSEEHRYYQRPGKSGIAIQRMKIIKFYERYGEKATLETFGLDRRVINRWRKKLKENKGKIIALLPLSTRPKRVRKSIIPHGITEFIKAVRQEHPKLGKEKIKPLLDEYCRDNGIKIISESTIGNIIKKHNFFFQKGYRLYENPGGKKEENDEDVEL